jgi:pyruvate,water dikinase
VFRRIARLLGRPRAADLNQFKELFERFQEILDSNNRVLEIISELEDKLGGDYIFDIKYLRDSVDELSNTTYYVVSNLNAIAENRYRALYTRQATIRDELQDILQGRLPLPADKYVIDYDDVDSDLAALAGEKSASLGEIRNHLGMPTPAGFVITTSAYRHFMAHNDLWQMIHTLHANYEREDKGAARSYDDAIDRLFEGARVPSDIARAVERRLIVMRKRAKTKGGLAVRSSAYGEDSSRQSYAGQFLSLLNCAPDDVLAGYVKVLASRMKHGVFAYAGELALQESELPMAVAVQQMITARTAGVAYSVEPSRELPDCLAISAGWGLGLGVVGGTMNTDFFTVSRMDPTRTVSRRVGRKATQLVPSYPAGVASVAVPEDRQEISCLTDGEIARIAETVLMLDRYFKRPVDVEWCLDEDGGLHILQCRPLNITRRRRTKPQQRAAALASAPVLMRRRGQVAQRGIAAGKVRRVDEDDEASDFPVGAIAVTKYTTPRLASIIRRAAAIITDVGSPTGHMATVAREFGVPMVVNTVDATTVLTDGTEVTLDAEENVVYKGIVRELLEYEVEAGDVYRDLEEYHILRQLLRRISPLHLLDPNSADFSAKNCRTYHDIVRFSHEMAVKMLINLNVSSRRFRGVQTRRLKLPVPLGLDVIDLGGGLAIAANTKEIDDVDKVRSQPMRAILTGLVSPGAWSTEPVQLGFGDIVSSLTRYAMTDRAATFQGQNLAVISGHYANITLRLGYHFNVIDTYVSSKVDDNYIYFRFVGGVTETERRRLRAILIKEILEKLNFRVAVNGDLVVGRLKKLPENDVVEVLRQIGRLIGFTRQLDTQMQSEQSVVERFDAFFKDRDTVS